jgi:hypothetical protein
MFGLAISPIRFWIGAIGHGSVKDGGGNFVLYGYTSSYFIDLVYTGEGYSTPEKTEEVFEGRVKEADIVLERTLKPYEGGVKVGKRALAVFHNQESSKQYACVYWTHGRGLSGICSPSLMHVLSFERQIENYLVPVKPK